MTKQRLPSLDGLRAVSIAMVLVCHSVKVAKASLGRLPYGAGLLEDWGSVGVTIFFVISGFLITSLLCEERAGSGSINLRGFYLRRAFRILPAYWAYLAAMVLLAAGGAVAVSAPAFAAALAFITDYLHVEPWVLGHSWSLSVEEQFYLCWPLLLMLCGGLRARRVALALMVAAPVLRILTYELTPALRPAITAMLHLRVDALMIGCWAALERQRNPGSRVLAFLGRPSVALVSAATAAIASPVLRHFAGDWMSVSACYSLEALGACSVLLWAIAHPRSLPGRVLNAKPIAHLGALSYSLYLWQQPWLNPEAHLPLRALPLLIAGAVLCAELSFRFVERPMLSLRARLLEGPQSIVRLYRTG